MKDEFRFGRALSIGALNFSSIMGVERTTTRPFGETAAEKT